MSICNFENGFDFNFNHQVDMECDLYIVSLVPPFCRWVVENQIGRKNLVIDDCDAKQSVYIFGCKDSVLQVQGNFYTL